MTKPLTKNLSGSSIETLPDILNTSGSSFDTLSGSSINIIPNILDFSQTKVELKKDEKQPVFYDNSWENQLSKSYDNVLSSLSDGVSFLADTVGADETAAEYAGLSEEYKQSALDRPPSSQSPSVTTEFPEWEDQISEGEVGDFFDSLIDQAKTLTATALPSIAPSLAAVFGTKITGDMLLKIPGIGPLKAVKTGVKVYKLAGMILPGLLMTAGEIHRKAKELGVSDSVARLTALTGGSLIGALDAWGASAIVNSFVKGIGKKNAVDYLAKTLGEKTAAKVVKEAAPLGTKKGLQKVLSVAGRSGKILGVTGLSAGKGFLKGGATEMGTEGLQEIVQIAAPHIAAGEMPESMTDSGKRVIDAMALGFFGGGPTMAVTQALPPLLNQEAKDRADELAEGNQRLARQTWNADTDLATIMTDSFLKGDTKKGPVAKFLTYPGWLVQRSTSFLTDVAHKTELGSKMINDFNNFYNDTSQEIGAKYSEAKEAVKDLKKDWKVPFSKPIKKEVSTEVARNMRYSIVSPDPKINKAAKLLRNILGDVDRDKNGNIIYERVLDKKGNVVLNKRGKPRRGKPRNPTGLYKLLVDSGVNLNFVDNYLTQSIKLPLKGLGRGGRIKKLKQILEEDPNIKENNLANPIIDNIIYNDGTYQPEEAVDLFQPPQKEGELPVTRRSFEFPRRIPKRVIKRLDEEGFINNNVESLINKAIISSIRRAKIEQIRNKYYNQAANMELNEQENWQVNRIFQALQGNYHPLLNRSKPFPGREPIRKFYPYLNTMGYLVSLGAASFSALSEPLIVLSKVNPKHAIWGAIDTAEIGLYKALRTVFPKIRAGQGLGKIKGLKKTGEHLGKLEDSFNLLQQTADLALVDSIRDIGNVAISKRVTDRFFRATLLAQVTQVSRYMASAAVQRQMKDDLSIVALSEEMEGPPTRQSIESRRRLREQGLNNVFISKRKGGMSAKTREQIKAWANNDIDQPPPIIIKSIGKTVDEVIMSPNVVNRPLWMSNPWLAPVALIKGFMMVFGNTVAPKLYRDVVKPLGKGRIPVEAITRNALTWTLLLSAIYGQMFLRYGFRYGAEDEDNPLDRLTGPEKLIEAARRSNIAGWGHLVGSSLEAERYGGSIEEPVAGIIYTKMKRLAEAGHKYSKGDPRKLAKFMARNIPLYSQYTTPSKRKEIEEWLNQGLYDFRDLLRGDL